MAFEWLTTILKSVGDSTGLNSGDALVWGGSAFSGSDVNSIISNAGAMVRMSSHQTVTQSVSTAPNFDVEVWDPLGLHDTSVNPDRFTIPSGGLEGIYEIGAFIRWTPVDTGTQRRFDLNHYNSGDVLQEAVFKIDSPIPSGGGIYGNTQFATLVVNMQVGDYVRLRVQHNSPYVPYQIWGGIGATKMWINYKGSLGL